jgi:hypothetical protein
MSVNRERLGFETGFVLVKSDGFARDERFALPGQISSSGRRLVALGRPAVVGRDAVRPATSVRLVAE